MHRRRQLQQQNVFDNEQDPDENDQMQPGSSAVVLVNETHRRCHLASILPHTEENENNTLRQPIDFRVYYEAAGFLAMQHFNDRDPRVLPHLPEQLKDCNVQLSMEMRDTRFSPIYAAKQLQEIIQRTHSTTTPHPIALVGAARSAVSQTLSFLSAVYELPQVSASSTSAALDNKGSSPFFARTVPTNQGDAKAIVLYLQSLGVEHMGVIYIRDGFGTSFHSQIIQEATSVGIQVVSTSFDANKNSIVTGIKLLKESGYAYFIGIFNPKTWKDVVREASRAGIMGSPDFVWLLSDASQELTQPGFRLNRHTEADLAAAVDGTGVVLLTVETNVEFDDALSELQTDEVLQEKFVAAHVDQSVFDGYTFPFPGSALYQYLNYDAVMALGIAACEAPQTFFTGSELYDTLLQTEFLGVSGLVRFSNETGTRDEEGLIYHIENVRIAQNQTNDDYFMFTSRTAVEVDFADSTPVRTMNTFVYAGGSTIPPPELPPLDVDLNLISRGIRITGLLFGSLSMFCAFGWLVWTIYYRNKDVVRIAQPIFLCQLCVGAFIMAISVIPMSMQENVASERQLDIACMATPWLLSVGFVIAFSALFSKTWRLNKLFQHGKAFRRIQVKARDVMVPFLVLTSLNVLILVVWTIVSPLQWERVWSTDVDQYERSTSSYGTCYGGQDGVASYVFVGLLVLVNIAAIAFALYQSYRARNLPTDFNENYYVSVTTFSLLESMILGGPLLLLVHDNPSADFLIKSLLVTFVCSTILLFMFVPKYLQRNLREMRSRRGSSVSSRTGAYRRTAALLSNGNRFSTFSSQPHSGQSSSSSTRSTNNGSFLGRRRSSTAGSSRRPSLKLAKRAIGQSTICRNEDYFLQRRSDQALKNRSSLFGLLGATEQGDTRSSFPTTNPSVLIRSSESPAPVNPSLPSFKNLPSPSTPDQKQSSDVVSLSISAFDSVPSSRRLKLSDIQERSTELEMSSFMETGVAVADGKRRSVLGASGAGEIA